MLLCDDCGMDTAPDDSDEWEYYMVHDHVWPWPPTEPGGHNGPGILCVACLEARLGRELTADDFTDASINTSAFMKTPRLRDRLGL